MTSKQIKKLVLIYQTSVARIEKELAQQQNVWQKLTEDMKTGKTKTQLQSQVSDQFLPQKKLLANLKEIVDRLETGEFDNLSKKEFTNVIQKEYMQGDN